MKIWFFIIFFTIQSAWLYSQYDLVINTGHSKYITGVKYSPNGKYFVTSSEDNTIKIWDTKSKLLIKTIYDIGENLEILAITSNDKLIVTDKKHIWIFILRNAIQEKEISLPSNTRSVAISPDLKTIASGSWNSEKGYYTIHLIAIDSGDLIHTVGGYNYPINDIKYSSNGKFIAGAIGGPSCSGYQGDYIYIHSTLINECRSVRKNLNMLYQFFVMPYSFSFEYGSDNNSILIPGNYGIDVWNYSGRIIKSYIDNERHSFGSFIIDKENNYLIATHGGKGSGGITIWDYKTINVINEIKTGSYISIKDYCLKNNRIIGTVNNKVVIEWDILTGEKIFNDNEITSKRNISPLSVSKDGNLLFNNSYDTNFFNIEGEMIFETESPYLNQEEIAVSSNRDFYVSKEAKNQIYVRNYSNGDIKYRLGGHSEFIRNIALSKDNKYLVSCDKRCIKVWNLISKEVFGELWLKKDISVVAIDNKARFIAVSLPGEIRILDFATLKKVKKIKLERKTQRLDKVTFVNDHLLIGTNLYSSNNWKRDKGKLSKNIKKHFLCSNIFQSNNGQYLIGQGENNDIIVYDLKKDEIKYVLKDHKHHIYSIGFNEEKEIIISIDAGSTIKYWDISTGDLLFSNVYINKTYDFITIAPNGLFDCKKEHMNNIYLVDELQIIQLSSFIDNFYSPNLLEKILAGEKIESPEIDLTKLKTISPINH
jgi:WD40 repeat protein